MHEGQLPPAWLVLPSFLCLAACEAAMAVVVVDDAGHFFSSPPGGTIPCNTGLADMPLTKAKWEQIGKSIVGPEN